jgi:hypothetical protein
MCGPIQLQLILKIFRLSLMVHNVQLFENSNFPISLIENTIFSELDLYYSKYRINNVEATVDIL